MRSMMVAVGLDGAVRTGMWMVKGNALFLSEDRPPDRSRAPFRFHLLRKLIASFFTL
jgi:hypothetical protein